MREVLLEEKVTLMSIPGKGMCGILLPTSCDLTRDGLCDDKQFDMHAASKLFKVNRMVGEYTVKYGARVFYLGTYKNKNAGVFRLFSFPVRHGIQDYCDATVISNSCEQLLRMQTKFTCDVFLLPFVGSDLGMDSYVNCLKPIFDVMFDDKFIMVHREGIV